MNRVLQLLKYIPGHAFESLAIQHYSGRSFLAASRWSWFVTMALAQLAGRNSLRNIVEKFSAQAQRLDYRSNARLCISVYG